MTISARIAVALAVAVTVPLMAADEPPTVTVQDLGWLAGSWAGTVGSTRVEETWLVPSASSMLGVGRSVDGGRLSSFEFLRIDGDGGVIRYLASPGGRCPPTEFHLDSVDGQGATFVNPAHDFPRSIAYRREGDVLWVRLEGTEDGEPAAAEWSLARRP